jgi:hypothetical protein
VLRVVLIAIVVFATIYALVDCVQTDRRLVRIMPKPAWLLAILIPVAGPLGWFLTGRGAARGGPTRGSGGRPTGPRGPDDDPDFLRRL